MQHRKFVYFMMSLAQLQSEMIQTKETATQKCHYEGQWLQIKTNFLMKGNCYSTAHLDTQIGLNLIKGLNGRKVNEASSDADGAI